MVKYITKLLCFLCFFLCELAFAVPIKIVAAENFYGDIASKIGGEHVEVVSIMRNPNQDPHLFSSNWTVAKAVAKADLIICNGLDYDSWIKNLIDANGGQDQKVLIVAELLHKQHGDNPHIWYDPNMMLQYADILTEKLITLDSINKNYYTNQFVKLKIKCKALINEVNNLKKHYQGVNIIATEPVFNYMAKLLGLNVFGEGFQLSMMNNTEPSISDIKDFENTLQNKKVKLLIYNNQVTNPLTTKM